MTIITIRRNMTKRFLTLIGAILLSTLPACAQGYGHAITLPFAGVPTGVCNNIMFAINTVTGDLYDCLSGSWHAAGTTSATGTVTTFSSGNLSPLFTTSVANASTTPALSFTLSTTGAHTWFGNATGSTQAPTFAALTGADVPAINLAASGNGGVTGNLPVTNLNSGTSADSTHFWRGDGTWAIPPGSGTVTTTGTISANQVAYFTASTVITGTATDSTTTHALFATAGAPAFRAIAAGDIPTLNQNTTGSAAKWTTARLLAGNSTDGSANVPFTNAFVVGGTADSGLTGAQFLGSLTTGLVKNTTGAAPNLSIAANSDVIALWTGPCTSSNFLRGDGSCATPTSSGAINNSTQFSIPYYSVVGTANTLSGIAGATAPNGVPQTLTSTPSGGVATIPALSLPGLGNRNVTGTTSTDTILSTDCNPGRVDYQGSVAVATTLPTATTLGVPSCSFRIANNTSPAANVTVTPTTWTVNGSTTQVIHSGQLCTFTVDAAGSAWDADCPNMGLVAGSNITITPGQFGPTISSTSTGVPGGSNTQLQYNNSGSFGGTSGWTTNGTTTITGGSSSVLDLSAMAPTAGLKLPTVTGAVPTADSFIGTNSTTHTLVWGSNGTTIVGAAATTGTGTATTCTNQVVTAISALAAPTCTSLTSAFLPSAVVYTNTTNTASSGMTLDMSGATGASAFRTPAQAGYTSAANGALGYDTTAGVAHQRTAGADSLSASESSAITSNTIPKASDSTHAQLAASSLTDNGTTVTSTDPGGYVAPVFVANGSTAGFADFPQGSTSASVAPCNTANSICEMAPTSVTSYTAVKPGAAANGILVGTLSSSTLTQGFTGDTNHSTLVTIGSGTSIGSTSLCSSTFCPVGTYRIDIYIDITTACTTGGTYSVSLIYTDDTTVSKTITFPISGAGVTTNSLALAATTNYASGTFILRSSGSTGINYSTTAGACSTGGPMVGKMSLVAEPIQ